MSDRTLQWVASDHACCLEELKGDDLWPAQPGFGGTALIYPALVSEGVHRRGLSLERIVELVAESPARAFGCFPRKGAIMVGADADLVLLTPFSGVAIKGWPVRTILRGQTAFADGELVAEPRGEFLARPLRAARPVPP